MSDTRTDIGALWELLPADTRITRLMESRPFHSSTRELIELETFAVT
jgi:hypothetical protein